jgi:ADP-ribose pyrophosphatase YjhB (NUDIX family)
MKKQNNLKPGIDYIGVTTPFYCVDEFGRYLFHKRSKNCRDEHGKWDTGGGKLEFGLTPEQNVLKEVEEEYGCVGEILEQIQIYTSLRKWDNKQLHWLAIPFFIRVKSSEVKIGDPIAMDEIGFFKFGEFPTPLHPGLEKVLISHSKLFRKYSKIITKL